MTTPDPTARCTLETGPTYEVVTRAIISASYLNIHGTGRVGSVAKTLAITPALNVDLLADGRIAGIETLGGPVDATALLRVLHHVALVTPEMTAVLEAARRYRHSHAYVAWLGEPYTEPGDCYRFVQESMPLLLDIDAAVDAQEASRG